MCVHERINTVLLVRAAAAEAASFFEVGRLVAHLQGQSKRGGCAVCFFEWICRLMVHAVRHFATSCSRPEGWW